MSVERCPVSDGQEQCCLVAWHLGPHMGRWYTMTDKDIKAYEEEKRALREEANDER